MARLIPGKEEFHGLVDWFETMLKQSDVITALGQTVTPDDLNGFDEVIIATGVKPRDPDIPGQDHPHVLSYTDVLRGRAGVGASVAIIGAGGIAFDVAEFLSHQGASLTQRPAEWQRNWGIGDPAAHRGGLLPEGAASAPPARQITMLQRKAERPGKRLGKTTGWIHRAALRKKGVTMLAGVIYEKIDETGLHIRHGEDHKERGLIRADTIVVCAGQQPERSLASALKEARGTAPLIIGGADIAAELDAKRAIDQGTRLALGL